MELNWNVQRGMGGGGGAPTKTLSMGGGGYGYFLEQHNKIKKASQQLAFCFHANQTPSLAICN